MAYEKKEQEPKVCALPECSEVFWTARERKRFHTEECRKEYFRKIQMNVCPRCGERLLNAEAT